jgi:hypothetical protein
MGVEDMGDFPPTKSDYFARGEMETGTVESVVACFYETKEIEITETCIE